MNVRTAYLIKTFDNFFDFRLFLKIYQKREKVEIENQFKIFRKLTTILRVVPKIELLRFALNAN